MGEARGVAVLLVGTVACARPEAPLSVQSQRAAQKCPRRLVAEQVIVSSLRINNGAANRSTRACLWMCGAGAAGYVLTKQKKLASPSSLKALISRISLIQMFAFLVVRTDALGTCLLRTRAPSGRCALWPRVVNDPTKGRGLPPDFFHKAATPSASLPALIPNHDAAMGDRWSQHPLRWLSG
jgi:hypothetical protein